MNRKSVLLGIGAAVFFSLLFLLGIFWRLEYQVYDFLLSFRAERDFPDDVVFLDVDDNAIAYNGVFPWPRSITADALLRLKEFGARAAIFDIEYIDKGPQGVDTIYLNHGLPSDFGRSFSGINSAVSDFLHALRTGSIRSSDIDEYAEALSGLIGDERDSLFTRVQGVARDNDQYLISASALFGRSWASFNLREHPLLEEEQISRRPIAEENFSYPIKASHNAFKGKYTDILPTIPGFALSAMGAGFTNVEIDRDGTRRRIDLAQNIHNHWYLQLSFSPLVNYLGNPEIELGNRRMLIKNAKMPSGVTKDISIPLDGNGRMILDWPKNGYFESYRHISFYDFSLLEDLEAGLEQYSRAFSTMQIRFFARFDPALTIIPFIAGDLESLFDAVHMARAEALETCSDELFQSCVAYRGHCRDLIKEILSIDPASRVRALIPDLIAEYPDIAEGIIEEGGYIANTTDYLKLNLERYEKIYEKINRTVKDRFCILGRVDTGTTDYGSNPFYGEYVNVGTHGVVLDMILSESFIFPVSLVWLILFTLIFVFMFFLISRNLNPVPRVVSGFLAILLVVTGLTLLFHFTGIFANPLLTVFAMIVAVILREIVSYAYSEREKQFIRRAFSTYVSGDVVKEIISDPSRLQLGGTMRHMTALFTDVEGFSTISEQLDPESIVGLLNRYLTFMSDAILEEKGTIDKYEGDAIIAFFGAPVPIDDHATRACLSAIAMKRIEAALNKKVLEDKLSPTPLLTRIGINTGDMVAGNMGTGKKMNYTIMGNAVNLAARLEGVNKKYGTWIIISDDTLRETDNRFLTRKLDRVRVVGINEPVGLHELLELEDVASTEQKKMVQVFHQALEYYESRKWNNAIAGFREAKSLEKGGPSAIYLRRCTTFLDRPPPDTWDGVNNLTEK